MPFKNSVNSINRQVGLLFVVLGILLAVIVESNHWHQGSVVEKMNYLLYDIHHRYLKDTPASQQIVIVDIDEESLQTFGQWPWPRYRLGQLTQIISVMQPRGIGIDILMPEPDRSSLQQLQTTFQHDFGIDLIFPGVPDALQDNDIALRQALFETGAVTSHYFYFDHFSANEQCTFPTLSLIDTSKTLKVPEAPGIVCNTEKLQSSNQTSGFINVQIDSDGILRRLPLFIKYNNEIHPNLALAAIMQKSSARILNIRRDFFGFIAEIDEYEIPIEPDGSILLNFSGAKGNYSYISAKDLLQKNVDRRFIEDKFVFIGSSAAGLFDFVQTPYDTHFPGVEILGVAAGNILDKAIIRQPVWKDPLSVVLSILTGFGLALLFILGNRPLHGVTGTLSWVLLLAASSIILFSGYNVFMPLAAPLIVSLSLFTIFSAIRFGMEHRASFIWYQKLARSQQVTLESLATVVETRDYETGGHIKRTSDLVRLIAEQLAVKKLYPELLTPAYIQLLYTSAPLHDIGKIGVPDSILLKPGPLTIDEYEQMKKHTEYGYNILLNSGKSLGGDNFLNIACEIAHCHHERWDGKGYPQGLRGKEIPLSARIMAVADVYDALISRRCYKLPVSHEKSVAYLTYERAGFFDPEIIDAFCEREQDIIKIMALSRDNL